MRVARRSDQVRLANYDDGVMANSIAALARCDYIAPLPVAIVREPGLHP